MNKLISTYTNAVLAFDFKESDTTEPLTASSEDITAFVDRTVNIVAKSCTENLILFGLGNGEHALGLAKGLPASTIIVCETDLNAVRAFLKANPEWAQEDSNRVVIGDVSMWAQLYLLALANISPDNATQVLNPTLSDESRQQFQALQRLFMQAKPHQAINSSYLSHVGVQAPDLSVGVILSPDEPELDTFFSQFPDWVKEIVVVWDSETVPEREFSCAAPITHLANPLEDFAAQRNIMLDNCTGDWVLSLDGDEMFSEDVWGLFTACMLVKRLEACYFPRMTFYPDESHTKVGYGLWPDLQLRLFKNMEGVRYERPVHERLTGIKGRTALALDAPILHYSRLRKTPEELAAKLKRFDETSEGMSHVLSEDYPHIQRSLIGEASFIMGSLQMLLLEENPA